MSEANKHKSDFAGRLPKHSPGKDLWPGIEKGLGADGLVPLSERLPKHKPGNLWPAISRKLPVAWYSLRSNYMRGILAGLLILAMLFIWYDGVIEKEIRVNVQSERITENKPSETRTIVEKNNEAAISESEKDKSKNHDPGNQNQFIEMGQVIDSPDQKNTEIRESGTRNKEITTNEDFENQLPVVKESEVIEPVTTFEVLNSDDAQSSPEPYDEKPLPELYSLELFKNSESYIAESNRPQIQANSGRTLFPKKEVVFEAGIFLQPSMIRNISTIHDDWVYSPGFGASIGMVQNRFLLETGVSLSRVEFEDKIEVDYFAFVFLGTVITPTQQIEEYVNEQGDTLTQVIYSVEVIDVYDSVFVEDEKNDIVKLSTTTIPLTAGYRVYDEGRKFIDLKTGLDMMIITGRVIPGNPQQENIKVTDVRNSLASKYSLKWKYHISIGAGLRMSEKMSLYAEPTLWWYPDGVRNGETLEIKHPFEAGMKLGLKWTF